MTTTGTRRSASTASPSSPSHGQAHQPPAALAVLPRYAPVLLIPAQLSTLHCCPSVLQVACSSGHLLGSCMPESIRPWLMRQAFLCCRSVTTATRSRPPCGAGSTASHTAMPAVCAGRVRWLAAERSHPVAAAVSTQHPTRPATSSPVASTAATAAAASHAISDATGVQHCAWLRNGSTK